MSTGELDLLKLLKGGNLIPRFAAHGLDLGEIEASLANIQHTKDWGRVWGNLGEEHAQRAEDAVRAGHRLTAGETFIRAALCHHFAQFLSFEIDEQKSWNQERKIALYTQALPFVNPPIERISIPFEGLTLPGYLRFPKEGGPFPCVVFVEGTDSAKEESIYHYGNPFLRRGMAALAFDGPGQGETWPHLKMRPDYEQATAAAIDYLTTRPEVDSSRIGVVGKSFGGHLAPRSAAADDRIRACVSNGGYFDTTFYNWGEPLRRIRFQYICGTRELEETKAIAAQFTLAGRAERIRCPVLVIHGERDSTVPQEQAEQVAKACKGNEATFKLIRGGSHVCHNLSSYVGMLISDWMMDRLNA